MSKQQDHKVVILGASGVGKTCLGLRFVKDQFVNYTASTIGASFLVKELVFNGQKMTMQIWDTAGQERFQSITRAYYRGAHLFIVVFSVACRDSFEALETWLSDMAASASSDRFVVIVGNKIDVDEEGKQKRVISEKKAKSWCTSKGGLLHFECSAKEDINVGAAFEAVARFAVQNEEKEEDIYLPDTVSIDTSAPQSSGGCC